MEFLALYFSYISGSNFPSLKNKKRTLWKNFLYFRKRNSVAPSFNNSCVFSGEPLRVFHHCSCVFISPLYCFSGVFIVDWICSFHQLSLPWLSGTSFLCCCTASATDLRDLFLLWCFLRYTPSRHLGEPAFIKAFLGADSSSLMVRGTPTEVRQTDPTHLFVWITVLSKR